MKRVILVSAWQLGSLMIVWQLFTMNPNTWSPKGIVMVLMLLGTLLMTNIYASENK